MPKLHDDELARRVDALLDDAQRAFARYGYEATTVARLEEATGISRGGIFHHFPTKLDLFVAVAERSSVRLAEVLRERGVEAAIRGIAEHDPAWVAIIHEAALKAARDETFRRRWEQRDASVDDAFLTAVRAARRRGEIRTDVSIAKVTRFLGVVLDGVSLHLVIGDTEAAELIVGLVNDAIAPR